MSFLKHYWQKAIRATAMSVGEPNCLMEINLTRVRWCLPHDQIRHQIVHHGCFLPPTESTQAASQLYVHAQFIKRRNILRLQCGIQYYLRFSFRWFETPLQGTV